MNPVRHRIGFALALALALSLVSVPGALADGAGERLLRLAAKVGERPPVVRIGLDSGHSLEVSGRSGMRVSDPATGKALWRGTFDGRIAVVAEGGPQGEAPRVYRVQVGAFGARRAAEAELKRVERLGGAPGIVRHDVDRATYRVRVGRATNRVALNPLVEKLRASGMDSLWIAEEPADEYENISLRLVDASYDSFATGLTRIAIEPTKKGGRIRVGKTEYRGVMELRVTRFGTLQAINWVGIEAYLRGVVPVELGPEVWPAIEALSAQAVAARTYTYANLGQFEEDGYDLCAGPRCQVYGGYTAEHPLSDRAVATTRSEVATWNGEPIAALYTATCGGHTEDGSNVFIDHTEPYLKGVPCHAEGEALASQRRTVAGAAVVPLQDESGVDVTRDMALLRAAGVLDDRTLLRPIDALTLRAWTTRLARVAGLPAPAGESAAVGDLGGAAAAVLSDLGWGSRAEVLISEADLPALLRDPEAALLPLSQRRALAYLASIDGLTPHADGGFRVRQVPTAARLVPVLARIGDTYDAFDLATATVSGLGENSLRLFKGKGEIRLPFAERPYLFSRSGGKAIPLQELEIWPNDNVRYRTNSKGRVDFVEVVAPVNGVSDDRSSKVYSWQVRKTRNKLEAAINRRVAVGRLKDLVVVSRGVSGRVKELKVVGTDATTVVRGFDIRRLLDLREILTVIEIQRDDRGRIKAVVFAGKGWGHGVGLCQVGAFGMALRGATYREILTHYYTGVDVERISADKIAAPGS
ncbi:MAG: SpoIID/LytB domain-containing protein [bacterium]|nr:SpoIID/LytB domain-containing protein [bacterium]